MKIIATLLTLIALSAGVKLPSNFQKCNRNQPNFKECVFKAAQNGISQLNRPYKEINMPSLNPLFVTELTIGGGEGPVSLQQKFKNCHLYGMDTVKLDQFEFDFEKNEIKLAGVIPEVRKLCKYEVKGRVLLLPVNGRGDSTIILKGLKVTDTLPFEQKKKNNKTYLQFTKSSVTLDPELVSYDFVNSDDKSLSDAINPVLNQNWKEVFDDVKSDYEKLIDEIIMSVGNQFFSKMSMEELFD